MKKTNWVILWVVVFALVAALNLLRVPIAGAHTCEPRWCEPYWEAYLRVDLYQGSCTDGQAAAMERALIYGTYTLDRADPLRNYNYIDRTPFPGWGNPTDGIVTFDCSDNVSRNQPGETVLIDNCPNNNSPNEATCEDGSTRYITDAYVKINVNLPEWLVGCITLHEFGHIIGLGHSSTPGDTMRTGVFMIPYGCQLKETFSHGDWCSIRTKLAMMTEWPITTTTIDDQTWIHIPWVMPPAWIDNRPYYVALIHVGGSLWDPMLTYKPVLPCVDLGG